MVNRPAGGARSAKHLRAPLDWYVEPSRSPEELFHAIDFGDDIIWDGSCGRGTILEVAQRYGHPVFGSDLAHRQHIAEFPFRKLDILSVTELPFRAGREWSYVSNPPYGYVESIAERIIRHVLERLRPRRAAFLVPIAFLASVTRRPLFTVDFRPSHVCIHSDRITCPPGHLMDQMSNPFEGGMADYVWVVFTRPHRFRTETLWLEPGPHHYPPRRAAANQRGEAHAA